MFAKLKRINEDTFMSLGVVFVFLGFCAWLTTMNNQVSANTRTIEDIQRESKSSETKLNKIYRAMGRIEGKLGTKPLGVYDDEPEQEE